MKTQPTPTSPKYQATQPTGPKVWSSGELQRPLKTPFGRITLLIVFISLVVSAGVIAGLAWAVERYPDTWWSRWAPTSSTTVVEKTTATSAKIPGAVSQAAKTLYGITIDQSEDGVYLPGHVTGLSAPLSNNGWLVTLRAALPAGDNKLVVLPALGQPLSVNLEVTDPATPFIFLKTDGLNQTPATINPVGTTTDDGLSVWVISQVLQQTTVIARRLLPPTSSTWLSADQQERFWQLDAPTPQPAGSAVVDQAGHFIGLLGENSRVWTLDAVEPALQQLVQSGTIDRPWLGLRYVDRSAATVTGQPAASGLLVGASSGTAAVTPKSPAEKAGIKDDDVIVNVDGQPAGGDLFTSLLRFHPGDTVTIAYERLGKKTEVQIKLGVLRP